MHEIYYFPLVAFITGLWILVRILAYRKSGSFSLSRELQLLLVYVCIVVVARFTFFPFSRVNGKIQPLLFDAGRILPMRINLIPFANLFDYAISGEAMLNVIGNTAMFLPLGIVFPGVYKGLNTHYKVLAAGAGFSLCIEILQMAFFDRVTDIDDLILNTLGYTIGYGIWLLFKIIRKKLRK